MTLPFFSVIIPTCNRQDALSLCLDKLAEDQQEDMTLIFAGKTNGYDSSSNTYEVIVSDDSQDTATQAWVETHYPWVRYSRGPQKGPAANRNNGAKQAHGTWLVFTDDDCLPQSDWLSAYADTLKTSKHALALEGRILANKKAEGDLVVCPSNEEGGNFWSANIALKKVLYDDLGGFDEYFPFAKMEDIDLRLRVEEKTPIPFVQDSVVLHPVVQLTLAQSLKREFCGIDSHGYLLAKHPNKLFAKSLLQMLYNKYKSYAKWALYALFKGHIKRFITLIISLLVELPLVSYYYLYHKKKTFKI